MNDDASSPRHALVPAPERAMVQATDRLLAVASAVNDEAERERFKAFIRRHPDLLVKGLSCYYPLDGDLIEDLVHPNDAFRQMHPHRERVRRIDCNFARRKKLLRDNSLRGRRKHSTQRPRDIG